MDKAIGNNVVAKSVVGTSDGQGVTAETRGSGDDAKSATEAPAGQGITKKASGSNGATRTGMLRKVTSKPITFAKTTTTNEPMEVDPSPPKHPASPVPEDDNQVKPKKPRVTNASRKWHIYNKIGPLYIHLFLVDSLINCLSLSITP
jgi:hypothetical protein